MLLTILGNNGPYPVPNGACSGYFVVDGRTAVQLDLGCGTLAALTARTAPERLDALIFSHWHHDHCSDVLPLIYRMADVYAQTGRVLTVYGPEDGSSPEYQAVSACPAMTLRTIKPGDEFDAGSLHITVFEARHPVPAVMYRLQGGDGKVLCYTGDTNTIDCLPAFAADADLLLADGLFPEENWSEQKPHLSAALAAQVAAKANAKQLIITHLNPNYVTKTLLQEARAHFRNVSLAEIGDRIEL